VAGRPIDEEQAMKRREVVRAGAQAALGVLAALAGAGPAFAQAPNGSGEVTKLDKAGGRIEIKHGGIKALDMPPMRMTFRARDPRMLEGLAVGDKVRFTAEKIEGQFTVTAIGKAP
jgi:Cu/Ag efflux protein CusF